MMFIFFLLGAALAYLFSILVQAKSFKSTFGSYVSKDQSVSEALESENVVLSNDHRILSFSSDQNIQFASKVKKVIPDYIFGRNEFWYICYSIQPKENSRVNPDSELHQALESKLDQEKNSKK